jgi:hypothetical protein
MMLEKRAMACHAWKSAQSATMILGMGVRKSGMSSTNGMKRHLRAE